MSLGGQEDLLSCTDCLEVLEMTEEPHSRIKMLMTVWKEHIHMCSVELMQPTVLHRDLGI